MDIYDFERGIEKFGGAEDVENAGGARNSHNAGLSRGLACENDPLERTRHSGPGDPARQRGECVNRRDSEYVSGYDHDATYGQRLEDVRNVDVKCVGIGKAAPRAFLAREVRVPRNVCRRPSVVHHHALWFASAPRRVDEVRQVHGQDLRALRGRRLHACQRATIVQFQLGTRETGGLTPEGRLQYQTATSRFVQDLKPLLRRPTRQEGQIRRPRLEAAQNCHHHLQAPLLQHANEAATPDAFARKPTTHCISHTVELFVSQ
mmetsp:Transcript_98108/g.299981  ORF Transcript_98108/g.299981 Transcript_98108/m.299981 type:complete len:262 (-) Transcript_98108:199-984(-)